MFGRDEGGANHARNNSVVTGLAAFFATMYFVQGLGDPTSGLIAQPVRSLLRSWGESPAAIAGFMALLAVPWTLKPLFGLLSDYLPFLGYRRRGYLLVATAGAAIGLLVLWLTPLPAGERWLLFVLLLVPTIGIAFGDVLVDALMIERGQPLGLTGRLQSVQWAAAYIALLLTGVTAGYLANEGLQTEAFGLCALLWGGAFVLAWFYAREPAQVRAPHSAAELRRALATPGLAHVVGIQFLWSMNPLWVSVLYLHLTDALGFSEQVYGNTYSLFSAGCVVASLGYAVYCRHVRMGFLLHASIVTGIVANAVYWSMSTPTAAYVISVVAGWAYMTGMLIQLDLAARVVPIPVAATLFALIMALTNFAASLSEALGGYLYEYLQPVSGELAAYRWVVLISMGFAASCWLLVPGLKRAQPEWWHRGDPAAELPREAPR
ncbi:MAG: hypothetical protein AB7I04_23720 [Pseudomonadales bacterium]